MSLFSKNFQNRLPRYARQAQQLGGAMIAFRPTMLPAGGTAQTGLRDYAPGDDVRRVDWGICARHDELRVREFRGEAVRYTYLFLDVSRSMAVDAKKMDAAKRCAMTLGYALLRQNSYLTAVRWGESLGAESVLRPVLGMSHVGKVMRFLEETTVMPQKTDFSRSAERFTQLAFPKGQVFVISDFFGETDSFEKNFAHGFTLLRTAGFPPHAIHITSPADAGDTILGDVEITDAESGYSQTITITHREQHAYRRLYERYIESVPAFCQIKKMRYTRVATDMTPDAACLAALGIPVQKNPV